MRIRDYGDAFKIWVSAQDTEDWATNPNAAWPCSTLRGKRFVAEYDTNGLLDLSVNGLRPNDNDYYDANELSAIVSDYATTKIAKDHPCYFVAIGQFKV